MTGLVKIISPDPYTVEPVRIFSSLKEIGLYDKIQFSKVEVCLTTFDFLYVYSTRWSRFHFKRYLSWDGR